MKVAMHEAQATGLRKDVDLQLQAETFFIFYDEQQLNKIFKQQSSM
ncbi:MAG: hypothetical protein PF442_00770 [Desulfobulbaceae bacterium]|nr:hypothetical protein [Desulfobulbaceae bacterium]